MLFRIASMRLLTHTVIININSADMVRLFIIKLDAVAYTCPCILENNKLSGEDNPGHEDRYTVSGNMGLDSLGGVRQVNPGTDMWSPPIESGSDRRSPPSESGSDMRSPPVASGFTCGVRQVTPEVSKFTDRVRQVAPGFSWRIPPVNPEATDGLRMSLPDSLGGLRMSAPGFTW